MVKVQDQLAHRLYQVCSSQEEIPNLSHSQQREGKCVQKPKNTLPCTQCSSCEGCQLHNICTTYKAGCLECGFNSFCKKSNQWNIR